MPNSKGKKSPVGQDKTMQKHKRKSEYARVNDAGVETMEGWDKTQEEKYRMLVQNIPCVVYTALPGEAGPTTFMSNKWKDWTGYSPEELYCDPQAWPKCIHPDDEEHTVNTYIEACRDRIAYNLEYRVVHKETGQVRCVRDQGHLSKDEKGAVVRVDGIVTDITELKDANNELDKYRDHLEELVRKRTAELTCACEALKVENKERKRAEQALREVEGEKTTVLENLSDLIVYRDRDMVTLWASKSMANWHGMSQEQIIGRVCYKARYGRDEPCEECHIVEAMKSGQRQELEMQLPDEKCWHVIVNPVFSDSGQVIGTLEISQDITERKQSEEALRETTNLLETIFEHTHMLLACFDPQFNFVRVNRAYAEADERQPSFFYGKNHFDLYPNKENEVIFRRVVETGIPYFTYARPFEYAEHPERRISYWDWSLVPIKNQQGIVSGLVMTLVDVTARKRAEEALKDSEDKLNAMLQSISDHMSMVDKDLNILWANDVAKRRFGDDIVGKKCYEVYHGRQRPCEPYPCLALRAFQDGGFYEHDTEVIDKDGNTAWFHCVANVALRNEEGEATAVLEISTDITERVRAEQALQGSEERFRTIYENALVGLYRTTSDGRILMANPALVQMLGYSSFEELAQLNLEEDGFSRDYQRSVFKQRVEAEDRIVGLESRWMRRDGTTLFVRESARTVRDKDGEILYYEGTVADLTERKKAEEELRIREQKLRALINAPTESAILVDTEGTILDINRIAAQRLGKSVKSLIGMGIYEYLPTDIAEYRKAQADEVVRSGRPVRFQDEREGRDYDTNIYPVFDDEGKVSALAVFSGDITERKRAEEALQLERDNFINILDSMEDGIYIVNRNYDIQYVNPVLKKDFGLYEEHKCYEYFHDRKEVCSWCKNKEVFAGKTVRWEWYSSENQRTYDLIDTPLRNPDGSISKLEIFRDITERKRAEEMLRESEERLKILFESAPDAIYLIDPEGRFVDGNRAAMELIGFAKDEVIGKNLAEIGLLSAGQLSKAKANLKKAATSKLSGSNEYTLTRKDGSHISIEVRTFPVKIRGKMLTLGIARDITDHKQAEEAVRKERDRAQKYLDVAAVMFVALDDQGNVTLVNKRGCELLGWDEPEIVGKNWFDNFLPENIKERVNAIFLELIAGKIEPTDYYENSILCSDGSQKIIAWYNTLLKDGSGNIIGTLSSGQDITKHKQAEKILLGYQAQLKSLASQLSLTEERERHRLATELHDQIGQSLVISKIKLDQLRKSSSSNEFNEPLEDICNCLGRIIDDTRTLTFDLSYPILYELGFEAAVAEWLTDQVQEKHGIKTEFEDDGHQKPLDEDIRMLLFRNVRELLVNVIKHAQANKVRVSIRRVNEYINVGVEDDGVGFDPVEVTSMAAQKAKFGLFSIRERLEQLGGLIEIESEPGRGSKITMIAPLKNEDEADEV